MARSITPKDKLAKSIKSSIHASGRTLQNLSDETGLNFRTISKISNGDTACILKNIFILSAALRRSPTGLMENGTTYSRRTEFNSAGQIITESTVDEDKLKEHFGKKLRLQRKKQGLRQEDVGTAIGVNYRQISKLELGQCRTAAHNLPALAKILNVDPNYFFADFQTSDDLNLIEP